MNQPINQPYSHNRLHLQIIFILLLWFAVALLLSVGNLLNLSVAQIPVVIMLMILLPPTVFGFAYAKSGEFRNFCLALDTRVLILLHIFRTVGLGFVFLYFHKQLPAIFALPAGLGDFITAFTAMILGVSMYYKPVNLSRLRAWNNFGIVDFIIAVTIGILYRADWMGAGLPANTDIMLLFPLSLIPGFFVPFFLTTHLIILLQIQNKTIKNNTLQ